MLFPSPYVHIGGDEVDKSDWKKCLKCQNRMKQENLKNENELQSYFIKRMEKFLIANKKKLIGWDEILEGGLAPEATVMSWRGEGGGIEAAKMKHEVVMTPGSPCYFDHYQAGPEGEPVAIGGFNSLKKVYDYNPVPQELSADDAKYVLGAQGNVWTEFISTTEHLEYMVLPRMVALAEVLWTEKENKNWVSFNQRLQYHFRAYQQKGLHYCPGNFKVNINPTSVDGKLLVNLSSEIVNGEIHYSVDGTDPTTQSNQYIQPFVIDSSVTVKAVVVVNNKVMGYKPAEQAFSTHKAIGCNVSYINPVSKYYTANGPNTLTDGIRGTAAPGKFWHGWNAKDLVATVDLKSIQKISNITLGCLQSYRDWIFLPTSVQFEISVDGINFIPVKTIINTISVNEKTALTHDFKATFSATDARFVRVSANVLKACPAGHSGAGQPAWIFADEIIVE
jgi:hexosaminidase